jgi:NAD+ diphosphatase
VNVFSNPGVDRLAERRGDAPWLHQRLRDPATRVLPLWEGRVPVIGEERPRVTFRAPDAFDARRLQAEAVLLGEISGAVYFAVAAAEHELGPDGRFAELRQVAMLLDPTEATLLAHARAMLLWHGRHQFCGSCGAPTASAEAGHVRRCGAGGCGAEHFPRTDPAVIVRITSPAGRCLLARQAQWAPSVFAVLAGFVEPGESLEDAVRREVREEVGLTLREVRYHSSQPWPFPGSLMLGFTAVSDSEELRLDTREIERAMWVTREQLRGLVERGEVVLPQPYSIAHALLAEWREAELSRAPRPESSSR